MRRLGNALAIVNPAAQNGNGARGAAFLRYAGASDASPFQSLSIETTREPGHARALAAAAGAYDTVVVVGGDGVVHEAVAGLLEIAREHRPALGLLPCGNGNDYARTLGMPLAFDDAFSALSHATRRAADVGIVNGTPFMQTLSFGLDAAIALGTHERRVKTGRTGTRLFLEEGIEQLMFHRDEYAYELSIDGGEPQRRSMFLFAVQVGPTYGGGFKICPDADPCDGVFDCCIAHPPIGFARAAKLFLSAKDGKHTGNADVLSFYRAKRLSVSFSAAPPAQVDGERIVADRFDISILPREIDVLFFDRRA
ncbi:MAG: YegS/Rv2252/BmrU family lipid kinase [Slackia faecicanis]|nr:YegS/Rv2252/BmrU family lipid kinase [Slackia faecicanis]